MRTAAPVPPIPGVDWCAALLEYRGAARELVARVKFRNQRAAVAWLADGMTALVQGCAPLGGATLHTVTWAPANPAHVRRRGFDHGELLARQVAARLGLPVERLLTRAKGAPLTGRSAAQREGGLPLSASPTQGTVLVVDDVITTRTTLATAAKALREAGAGGIVAVAAAYTPPPAEGVPCE